MPTAIPEQRATSLLPTTIPLDLINTALVEVGHLPWDGAPGTHPTITTSPLPRTTHRRHGTRTAHTRYGPTCLRLTAEGPDGFRGLLTLTLAIIRALPDPTAAEATASLAVTISHTTTLITVHLVGINAG